MPTLIQSCTATGVAAGNPLTTTHTFTATVQPHSALVVWVGQLTSASRTYVVSDSVMGITGWVKAVGLNPGPAAEIWYNPDHTGGSVTITITNNNATGAFRTIAQEWAFGGSVNVVATSTLNEGANSTSHACSAAGVSSALNVIAFCAGELDSTGATDCFPGSGYSEVLNWVSGVVCFQYKAFPSGCTNEVGAWTSQTSKKGTSAIALFAGNAITGTGALAFSASSATTGKETFKGTATLAFAPAITATGKESFTGASALAFGHSIAASGQEAQHGASALAFGLSIAATGKETHTAAGTLAFGQSIVGTAVERFTGTGAAAYPFEMVGSGAESITATGSLCFALSEQGTGSQILSGTAALAFAMLLSAGGEISGAIPVEGSLDLTFLFALTGQSSAIVPWGRRRSNSMDGVTRANAFDGVTRFNTFDTRREPTQ